MRRAQFVLGYLLVFSFGCASALRRGLVSCNPPPVVDTTGWQRIQSGPLSFAAPASFRLDSSLTYRSIHGGESWLDGGRHFVANYGYHDDLTRGTPDGDSVCRENVGGRPAFILWHANPHESWVGAQWSNQPGRLVLTVGGFSADAHDLPVFWTMLRTIQIDTAVLR